MQDALAHCRVCNKYKKPSQLEMVGGQLTCKSCKKQLRETGKAKAHEGRLWKREDEPIDEGFLFNLNPALKKVFKNVQQGYWSQGVFHPIRKSEDYNEFISGDLDTKEERAKRRAKNKQEAYYKLLFQEARKLDKKDTLDRTAAEKRWKAEFAKRNKSISQFVRSYGGIKPLESSDIKGELKRLSNRETLSSGLIKRTGKPLDRVFDAAIEAGYRNRQGDVWHTAGDFLYDVERDATSKQKLYPAFEGGDIFVNPSFAAIKRRLKKAQRRATVLFGAKKKVLTIKPKTPAAMKSAATKAEAIDEGIKDDSIAVLAGLGFTKTIAKTEVSNAIRKGNRTREEIVKAALKALDKTKKNPMQKKATKKVSKKKPAKKTVKKVSKKKPAKKATKKNGLLSKVRKAIKSRRALSKATKSYKKELKLKKKIAKTSAKKSQAERTFASNPKKETARKAPPSVKKIRKEFAGFSRSKALVLHTPKGLPKDVALLGDLKELKLYGKAKPVRFRSAKLGAYSNGGRRRLCIGLQEKRPVKNPAQEQDLGEVQSVVYKTAKPHLGFNNAVYFKHKFGEEGGARPRLILTTDGLLKLVGGDYTVKKEGIRN